MHCPHHHVHHHTSTSRFFFLLLTSAPHSTSTRLPPPALSIHPSNTLCSHPTPAAHMLPQCVNGVCSSHSIPQPQHSTNNIHPSPDDGVAATPPTPSSVLSIHTPSPHLPVYPYTRVSYPLHLYLPLPTHHIPTAPCTHTSLPNQPAHLQFINPLPSTLPAVCFHLLPHHHHSASPLVIPSHCPPTHPTCCCLYITTTAAAHLACPHPLHPLHTIYLPPCTFALDREGE